MSTILYKRTNIDNGFSFFFFRTIAKHNGLSIQLSRTKCSTFRLCFKEYCRIRDIYAINTHIFVDKCKKKKIEILRVTTKRRKIPIFLTESSYWWNIKRLHIKFPRGPEISSFARYPYIEELFVSILMCSVLIYTRCVRREYVMWISNNSPKRKKTKI